MLPLALRDQNSAVNGLQTEEGGAKLYFTKLKVNIVSSIFGPFGAIFGVWVKFIKVFGDLPI